MLVTGERAKRGEARHGAWAQILFKADRFGLVNQHREKRDSSRQEKHSQGKAGGNSPGESNGKSSEQRGGGRSRNEAWLYTDWQLTISIKKYPQSINDWSKKLKATLKPFFPLWDEDVLPLTQLGQVEKLSCLKDPSSTAFTPRSCTICTSLPGTILTSPSTPASPSVLGEQLLLPGTLRLIILGSSPAQCLDLENLFR